MSQPSLPQLSRRTVLAGAIGNVMEWFDFAVYGFFAPVIGRQFFPSDNPTVSLLAAFGVFASGFLARPVGAVFFGHLGDRLGRRLVLRLSVCMMGASTVMLGLIPNYDTIGIAAPILLLLMRLIQGFSVGGEYTGSIIYLVEQTPTGKRGIVGAWANFGAVAGFLLGSGIGAGITSALTAEQVSSWGWRLPFVGGSLIAVMAIFYRRSMSEQAGQQQTREGLPIVQAVKTEWRTMLHLAGVVLGPSVGFYMMFVYVTTFLSEHVGVPESEALEINTISLAALMIIVPVAGWLSDRVGRKPLLLFSSIGMLLFAVPLFWAIQHDQAAWILGGQLGFAVLIGCAFGTNCTVLVEITRPHLRCTTLSVAYNVTLAIFGGTTPLVATWLIERTGRDTVPAFYMMAMAAITVFAVLRIREPAFDELPS